MIPIVLARHIRSGLADYLETTFPMTNRPFKGSIRALAEQDGALSLDPFVSIGLPFRVTDEPFPFDSCLHPQYRPYAHQSAAFARIAAGESTLVATGTGSGKTECFLYPILDYCYRTRYRRNGIKAILVYPMNALAADQAKRIASLIAGSPELRNDVTVGMYVGDRSVGSDSASTMMTEDTVITDHKTLLDNPPDILLTNYKMLDYLLIRPEDSRLWGRNEDDTLRYFVVDEFHTFDGAQGTDLACLIRRLTDRLHTDPDRLCFVGTSATMGTDESKAEVCRYASEIFDTTFDPKHAVVTEDRLRPDEFFTGNGEPAGYDDTIPTIAQTDELIRLEADVDPAAYLQAAARAWLATAPDGPIDAIGTRIMLGERLKGSRFLATLAGQLCGSPRRIGDQTLMDELTTRYARFAGLDHARQQAAIDALIALVSYARSGTADRPRPFLNVQVQLWSKELRRLTASLAAPDGTVDYRTALELDAENAPRYLPVVNCRDCGGTAWIGFAGKDGRIGVPDGNTFYNAYFAFQPDNQFLVLQPCETTTTLDDGSVIEWFCPQCMRGEPVERFDDDAGACPTCDTTRIPITAHALELVAPTRRHYRCPFCASERSIALVGLRATPQISVMLSQLSADAFNDDDKSIVFSDSVQDASFRASALTNHTWRFALRNSAMDYLLHDGKTDATFAEFLDGQNGYYHRRYADDTEYAVRFIAPNMTWMREYESIVEGRPAGPDRRRLIDWIGRRVRLETLFEFGLRSRTGRTLEKSGCATLYFDPTRLAQAAMRLRERCINELGIDDGVVHADDWSRLLAGLLDLMRVNGAFLDPSYESYLDNDANRFLLQYGKRNWWSPGSYFDVLPRFVSTTPQGAQKDSYDTVDSAAYMLLADRYIAAGAFVGSGTARELLTRILDTCVEAGFVARRDITGRYGSKLVYGLDENQCRISTDITQLTCTVCGRGHSCATQNLTVWEGARCTTRRCPGILRQADDATLELSYYGKLYRSEPAERIRAAEHTSLLDGDDRTTLERRFKSHDHKPGDANVLTCTPTLEMGIDIGDLSTVILASMPPAQAQYIQRAGRAGRRDGNSLVLAVANSRPHDLYFYQRPEEMIGGDVATPHVFLQATAVLERQLIAYALDTWVHERLDKGEQPRDVIPRRLKDCLSNVRDGQRNAFPFSFTDYVQSHAMMLLDRFCALFGLDDSDESYHLRGQLERFLFGDAACDDAVTAGAGSGAAATQSLALRLFRVFQNTNDHIDELLGQKRQVEQVIADLDARPADSSYEDQKRECRNEIKGIDGIIAKTNKQNTFNFLCDQGVLPNYAFPETGVTLHTILKEDVIGVDGEPEHVTSRKRYESTDRDFVRPAASAITELAPGNTFYASGRKYTINRILFAKGDMDEDTVMWRLCPNCSHAEPASSVRNVASCPSCGSPQWADTGQERPMVRIDTVISEEHDSDSLVDGSNDERNVMFFVRDSLVDIDRSDVDGAWKIDGGGTDFAYEYVPRGTVREINFGKADNEGQEMSVAGDKRVRSGFRVCTRCGSLANDRGRISHSYACPNRTAVLPDGDSSRCLFLFREIGTEMLRVLVPGIADVAGSDDSAKSFLAAVMFGMSLKFGNVAHLAATLSNEPLHDGSGLRKTYLVIYDTVPGGTGYLKQIADDPRTLVDVLGCAQDAMEQCDCADGCYRCLYSYRQSRDLDRISKKTAMAMIQPVLADAERFTRIDTVSDVSVNRLLDSKLEEQFIEALRRLPANPLAKDAVSRGRRVRMAAAYVGDGTNPDGYAMTIGDSQWEVELQKEGSKLANVPAILSKPDFRLHCVSDDRLDGGAAAGRRRDVLVFTDGLRFHAGKIADDTAKREALRRCGYRVWSLTYDDVARFLADPDDERLLDPALDVNGMPGRNIYRRQVERAKVSELDPGKTSAMATLGYYLANPDAERAFTEQAKGLGAAMLPLGGLTTESAVVEPMAALEDALTGEHAVYGAGSIYDFGQTGRLRMHAGLAPDDGSDLTCHCDLMFDDTIDGWTTDADGDPLATLDDEDRQTFKREWASFWHVANLMQFSETFLFGTTGAMADGTAYAPLRADAERAREQEARKELIGEAWYEILSDEALTAEELHAAQTFSAAGLPAPDLLPGEDVEDESGEFITVTFAWSDRRTALVLPNEYCEDPKNEFSGNDWHIMTDETEVLNSFCDERKEDR